MYLEDILAEAVEPAEEEGDEVAGEGTTDENLTERKTDPATTTNPTIQNK